MWIQGASASLLQVKSTAALEVNIKISINQTGEMYVNLQVLVSNLVATLSPEPSLHVYHIISQAQ